MCYVHRVCVIYASDITAAVDGQIHVHANLAVVWFVSEQEAQLDGCRTGTARGKLIVVDVMIRPHRYVRLLTVTVSCCRLSQQLARSCSVHSIDETANSGV